MEDDPGPRLMEAAMNWNLWIRKIHRWLSITFTVAVVTYIAAGSRKELAFALGLFALIPLVLLLVTGLYMFALPYAAKWRALSSRASPRSDCADPSSRTAPSA
jgi:hypothetical protein